MTSVHTTNGTVESPLTVQQFDVAALKLHHLLSDSSAETRVHVVLISKSDF